MATIGYVRVSTDEQTTANQKQQITERYGKIDKWFTDEATSGTKLAMTRNGFRTLFDYVREGDTVVCVAVDRIGRNTIDLLQTVEALKSKGVALVSLREGFDLSTPAGEAMLTIMAALAKMELATLAERRAAGIKRAQAEGKHCGRPSKGDPDIIKAMFDKGMTWQQIAEATTLSKASIYRLKNQASK
ncbi:recombinase family protein [Salmonella enterica subsp. enterica serovar Bredeney]|nr:recombinase family protein [Salmonella enterica subsp. enterica serovar Bredeney]